jgi:hypothetical protein
MGQTEPVPRMNIRSYDSAGTITEAADAADRGRGLSPACIATYSKTAESTETHLPNRLRVNRLSTGISVLKWMILADRYLSPG